MLASALQTLFRYRGALAAVGLHGLLIAVIAWIGAPKPDPYSGALLVSIVEAPAPATPESSESTAPDFSPAPHEAEEAPDIPETLPAPTDMALMEDAARIADPRAPDRPEDSQKAPKGELSGAPSRAEDEAPRELAEPFRFHPLFESAPGPAQRFARALQCARLTPSQRANCPTAELANYAAASIADDARAAAPIYDPFLDVIVADNALSRLRRLQADPAADSPYRLAGTGAAASGRHMHAMSSSRAANQAAADTAGRVTAMPDPVWGD